MKRNPNVVWLVLCKTRRARLWHVAEHSGHLPRAKRLLRQQTEKFPRLDHRLFRIEIPATDVHWIARKR